jgi:hypothetical protein
VISVIGVAVLETAAILAVATATADGLRKVAAALLEQGGHEAMQLRVAEQYIEEFGNLAKAGNTLVVPANLAELSSMIALATNIAKGAPRPPGPEPAGAVSRIVTDIL